MADSTNKKMIFGTDLIPKADDTYYLGSSDKKWKIPGINTVDVSVSNQTLYITVTDSGSSN